MRVLLTGGTGFFGKAVMRALKEKNLSVRCVVRRGSSNRLPRVSNGCEVVETETMFENTAQWWAETCVGIDMVLHAAWYAEPGVYLSSDRNLECLTGTLALATGAAQAGVQRFVGVGTCFEYDLSHGHLSVDTPLLPETLYAATKASAFMILAQYLKAQDVSFLWARLFYLYGADENSKRLVPYLHQQLAAGKTADLTSGNQIRDYMDVDDAARLFVDDALSDRTGATNICSSKGRTVAEIAREIADIYGRGDLLNFGARPDNLSDPAVVVGIR